MVVGSKVFHTSRFDLNRDRDWESFDIRHKLTDEGIRHFVADYQSMLKQSV